MKQATHVHVPAQKTPDPDPFLPPHISTGTHTDPKGRGPPSVLHYTYQDQRYGDEDWPFEPPLGGMAPKRLGVGTAADLEPGDELLVD